MWSLNSHNVHQWIMNQCISKLDYNAVILTHAESHI